MATAITESKTDSSDMLIWRLLGLTLLNHIKRAGKGTGILKEANTEI